MYRNVCVLTSCLVIVRSHYRYCVLLCSNVLSCIQWYSYIHLNSCEASSPQERSLLSVACLNIAPLSRSRGLIFTHLKVSFITCPLDIGQHSCLEESTFILSYFIQQGLILTWDAMCWIVGTEVFYFHICRCEMCGTFILRPLGPLTRSVVSYLLMLVWLVCLREH